jgi:hypothetical protein
MFGLQIAFEEQWICAYVGNRRDSERIEMLEQICRKYKSDFEREMGQKAEWEGSQSGGNFFISLCRNANPADIQDWAQQHQWLKETAEKLAKVFPKYVDLVSKGA